MKVSRKSVVGEVVMELRIKPNWVYSQHRAPRIHSVAPQYLVELHNGERQYWKISECQQVQ